jgi:hypothetical protein
LGLCPSGAFAFGSRHLQLFFGEAPCMPVFAERGVAGRVENKIKRVFPDIRFAARGGGGRGRDAQ